MDDSGRDFDFFEKVVYLFQTWWNLELLLPFLRPLSRLLRLQVGWEAHAYVYHFLSPQWTYKASLFLLGLCLLTTIEGVGVWKHKLIHFQFVLECQTSVRDVVLCPHRKTNHPIHPSNRQNPSSPNYQQWSLTNPSTTPTLYPQTNLQQNELYHYYLSNHNCHNTHQLWTSKSTNQHFCH